MTASDYPEIEVRRVDGVGHFLPDEAPEHVVQPGFRCVAMKDIGLHAPKLLQRTTLGQWSSSEVTYDHNAFLYWPRTQLAVLPVQAQDFTGAIGYRLDRAGIAERGRIAHDGAPVRRAIVIGDRLYTVSDAGILASGLGDLAARSFAAFAG